MQQWAAMKNKNKYPWADSILDINTRHANSISMTSKPINSGDYFLHVYLHAPASSTDLRGTTTTIRRNHAKTHEKE